MKQLQAWRQGKLLIATVWLAEDAGERMRGLLGRAPLASGEAMLITPCRMVHTFGMAYALDLAFVDRHGQIRKLVRQLPPARMAGCLRAYATLEMPAGEIERLGLQPGDTIDWQ
ncbi:DUF192 domain-containing protein [Chitinimonas sp.]|uniref:DUF192 domain-containing protein n=1 Tax=Chitinimonas sp. TaxID=1934313 RepID=UPI0035B3DFA3